MKALKTNIPAMLACLAISMQLSSMLHGGTKEAHYVLSNKDGLSNNSVTCICQDSAGIVWTGTWEGLNAYNSSGFRIWKSNPADSNTLSSNIIRGISEQRPGVMWATTDYGVNRIDVRQDRIRRFYLGYEHNNPAKDKTFDLSVSDSRHVFCSAAGWGLAHYNESTDRMEAFNIPDLNTSDAAKIHCLGDNRLVIVSQQGHAAEARYRFLESGQIDIVGKTDLLTGTILTASFKTGTSLFLVSRDSLYRFHAGRDSLKQEGTCQKQEMKAFPLPCKGEVRAITEASPDEIIIAFYDYGVMRLNLAGGICTNLPALQDVNIFALHYGTQDILWAGTDGQGLWAVYDDGFGMNKVSSAVMFQSGRAPVRSFFKDGDRLYVGTKGNGIFVMDSNVLAGRYDKSNGLADNAVYAFERGYNDDVFIGTGESGLNVLSLRTGKISRIIPEKEHMFNEVYDIKRDDENGCLWIGTYGCGLIKLYLEYRDGKYRITGSKAYVNNKENPRSINSNIVFPLLQDGPDRLWVGTKGGGLDLLDIKNDTFTHSTVSSAEGSISSNDVSSLFFSRDSVLWVGTSYGLNRLAGQDGGTRIFESFTDRDGLVNNSTHGIAEDASGNLWISTSGGLSVFNPVHGSFTNYSNDDALQNNEYADGASLRSGDTVYFGGVDGYNWFNPDGIHMRTYKPNIVFNGIRIMDRETENIRQGELLTLRHNENFFGIQFSAIEFIDNAKCEYAYILEGFSTSWVYTDSGIASFTNVPPGKYTFKVRCTNGDKVWNSDTASISIRVRRPWWNTIAANCMYLLIMMALAYTVLMFFNERVRQRHELEIETLKKKKLVDTYEAKLRFFTNIAHEFMTPLTLIIGPIEQMAGGKYNLPPKVSKYHRIIYSNAERMRRLIQELIDFRRIDTDSVKPAYSNVDIAEVTEGILDNFSEINEEQYITIEKEVPSSGLPSICDRNAVEKILYNLISNAYKYTPAGGKIWISAEKEDGNIHFVITNSGKGIRPENIDKVFDRFVILDNYESQASKGSVIRNGIGMALVHSLVKMLGGEITVTSVPGESTTFRLKIPEGTAEQISASAVISMQEHALPDRRSVEEPEKSGIMEAREECEKIMIVDDEKSIRDLVADILGEDYRIIQAGNGTEAVEQLKQVRPDLIITDLNMPQMNGAELLKYVKANDITKSIPVIFLAFKSDMETETETYELGSEVFIPKPFSTRHLKAVVRQILKNRSVLKEWYNSALSSADVYQGNIVDASDKDFIVRLTQLIEDNISDENMNLDWLCGQLTVSRTQIYRKVKELASATPVEFIRGVKLDRAALLLRTTGKTIQEVMYSSGFNNKSYFYREFAAKYGCSPKEYRKNKL